MPYIFNMNRLTSVGKSSKARSIQIVKFDEKKKSFSLNDSNFKELLLKDDLKDREVVVISVAGAVRKGKSFLLSMFLRYLDAKYVKNDESQWLEDNDEPINGFLFKNGSKSVTNGIHVWSEIFKYDYEDGRKVAIILMDTQGSSERGSTVQSDAIVFALNALVSSVQILNLSQNILEDNLQQLHLFTQYGKLVKTDTEEKPFQNLMFLIRDWPYPKEKNFGLKGGTEYVKEAFEMDNLQAEQLKIREDIKEFFEDIKGYLMPYPGETVATDIGFNGKTSEIDNNFLKYLRILVPLILAPENLIVKKINNQSMKVYELAKFFSSYMDILKSDTMPQPTSLLRATANTENQIALTKAQEIYNEEMERFMNSGADDKILLQKLDEAHHLAQKKSLESFNKRRKIGGEEYSKSFREQLINDSDSKMVLNRTKLEKNIDNEDDKLERIARDTILKVNQRKNTGRYMVELGKSHYPICDIGFPGPGHEALFEANRMYEFCVKNIHLVDEKAAIMSVTVPTLHMAIMKCEQPDFKFVVKDVKRTLFEIENMIVLYYETLIQESPNKHMTEPYRLANTFAESAKLMAAEMADMRSSAMSSKEANRLCNLIIDYHNQIKPLLQQLTSRGKDVYTPLTLEMRSEVEKSNPVQKTVVHDVEEEEIDPWNR